MKQKAKESNRQFGLELEILFAVGKVRKISVFLVPEKGFLSIILDFI